MQAIMDFLNSPVPYVHATSNDALYAVVVIGGGTIAFIAWWGLCFLIRNGWEGGRKAARALYNRKSIPLRLILLNRWKIRGNAEDSTGPVDLRQPDAIDQE